MTAMPKILIVDDDEDIRSLLTDFFQRHAHTVAVAKDGTEMFAALEKQTVDIIILDLMLQGEDGFGLCQKLRSISRVPVIMLTAMNDHTDRIVGLEVGADDYVTKPFDQRELLARVKAVLRRTGEAAPARGRLRFGDGTDGHLRGRQPARRGGTRPDRELRSLQDRHGGSRTRHG